MITRTIQIQEFTIDELADQVADRLILKIEDYLKQIAAKKDDELLTRQETANYLKINSTTLWHWTNKGKLTSYGIGNRRYYKKLEVMDSLVKLNVMK